MASEDRAWEEIQIKAFTYWANGYLPEDRAIKDLHTDFCDGLRLVALSEALTKTKLKAKYNKTASNRVHYVEIVHLALTHLSKESGIKVASYGTEDFVDGKIKPILGFLWTLLRHFRVAAPKGTEDKPFEVALLAWIKETIEEYELPINDFTDSFANGQALLALLHKYDSTFVDYDNVDPSKKPENCTQAFSTAESKLNIPQLVDAVKLAAGNADERSMVLYLSLFQQAFVRKFAEQNANAEKTGIRTKLSEVEAELDAMKSSREELLTLNGSLQSELTLLRESSEDWKKKCQELEEENDRLKKLLAEQSKKLSYYDEKFRTTDELLRSSSEEHSELNALVKKLQHDIQTLQREKKDLEEERDELRRERDELTHEQRDMMDSMEAFKTARSKLEEEYKGRADLTLIGLDALRKNLTEHLRDMTIWKGYLEHDRTGYQSETIQAVTEREIASQSFEDQLASLSSALSSENTKLQALLKERELEETEKKAAAAAEAKENGSKSKSKK